ncbi:protein phosphatase 1 regulatory subunit 3A [Tenrec ecaudatus]|uniref:protein phosphatase 1 regulatory subunit 3A n=1 Tax=Tenrec ecaudatus TaxID=94439 RepID=UPI003F5A66CC
MEPSEKPNQISKDNFLEVPNSSDSLSEDEDVKTTFKPGFSPQPSRRGSDSSEDMYLDTPSSGTRRVSFADTFGFNLVSVKEFDCWELPSSSTNFDLRTSIFHAEEYVLCPMFDLPSSKEDLMQQLQVQKAILEATEFLPGSTSMKGIIRVLNISFEKLVYVRMSLDDWQTHYDILAEYVPNSCDGETDQFSFKISLVPPYQKDGSRVEFCIRYETSVGTFWSNNNGVNYTLVCQKKEQELEPVKPLEEVPSRQIKGCLKVKSSKEESSVTPKGINFENSKTTDTCVPTIVCSSVDKEDLGISHQNVNDVNRDHHERNEKELELMINEHLTQPRSAPARDEKSTSSTDPINLPNQAEGLEKDICSDVCTDPLLRAWSPSASAGSSLKRDFYCDDKSSPGNECGYELAEEIASAMEEIKPTLQDAGDGELKPSCTGSTEELDDNANPAHERGGGWIACPFSDQRMAGSLKKKHKGKDKKTETKARESLRRDLYSDESVYPEAPTAKGSSEKDNGRSEGKDEERTHLNLHERGKSFQSTFHGPQRKTGCLETSTELIRASSSDPTNLSSKKTTIPSQEVAAVNSPRTHLSWEKVGSTTPEHEFTASVGSPWEGIPGRVSSPRIGNSLKNDSPFRVEEEKSDWINPEDQNKNTQHKHNWNVLESQGDARGSKTNIAEQTKEQAPCEDTGETRDNTGRLKGTPPEDLFTCQDTGSCALSSLTDLGPSEKAGTACIIKTTSESVLESMSVREKAIIAERPQETARSDRPIKEKETAFDPHEGSNDDSHYVLCQPGAVGVHYDNDFEEESHAGVCKVHVEETEKGDTMSEYEPGKTCDREKGGNGNITSVEFSQVITGHHKTASKLDLQLKMLPTDAKIFPEYRDHGHVQELSMKTDFHSAPSAFNSGTHRASQNGSHISNHHATTSMPSDEQATGVENPIPTMTIQSISTESDYNCKLTNEIQGSEKYPQPEGVFKNLGVVSASSRKEICVDQRECSAEKSQGPVILISEPMESKEEARCGNEGPLNSGQSSSSGDKECNNIASLSVPSQENHTQSSESLLSKYTDSKISYILLFLVFLVSIYHFDLMTGLAFYLLSLYWLYWKGERQTEPVRKK